MVFSQMCENVITSSTLKVFLHWLQKKGASGIPEAPLIFIV